MFRESMDEDEGMFFVFESGSSQRFWMKNTRIPLDIGYISSDGVLIEIHKGKPYDLSGVPSHSNDIKFVLELNAGAYKSLEFVLGIEFLSWKYPICLNPGNSTQLIITFQTNFYSYPFGFFFCQFHASRSMVTRSYCDSQSINFFANSGFAQASVTSPERRGANSKGIDKLFAASKA